MTRELCIMACCFCRDPQFHAWLTEQAGEPVNEAGAKEFILVVCQVDSRNDLDRHTGAAQRFHNLVRKPFLEWKGEQE